jgi:hypothetical protein
MIKNKIIPSWQIFISLVIFNLLITALANEFVYTRDFFYHLLSTQMESFRIDRYVDLIYRYSYWSLIMLPLILLIKFTFKAFVLQIPLLFQYIDISIYYLFRLVMLASLALSIGHIMHYVLIYNSITDTNLHSLLLTKPLSLANFFGTKNMTPSSLFILNQFNVFELLWVLIIIRGLLQTNKIRRYDIVLIVFSVWSFILILQWIIYFFMENI